MISSEHALLIIDMQQGLFHGPVSPYQADALLAVSVVSAPSGRS